MVLKLSSPLAVTSSWIDMFSGLVDHQNERFISEKDRKEATMLVARGLIDTPHF